MFMEFYERLLLALKKDNLKEFESCMEINNCGTLRLGRFPVLSVMYLYKSRRILCAYEKKFLPYSSWKDIGEPTELVAKFRSVAGKCMRIYLNETVSPIEMLLLLDRNFKVKRVFPQMHVVPPIKQRLKAIYYIRWGLQAEFVRGTIVLERRPMTRTEKLKWLKYATCAVLCVALFVSTPFVINAFEPFIRDGNGALAVTRWGQINFSSDKVYALKNDVTVPSDFFVEEMNCELRGNGHVVTVSGAGLIGSVKGTLTDVVLNVAVDVETDEACGFVSKYNYGSITNVTVNVLGSLCATATEKPDSFKCGGIVATNYALIQDCTVNYDNFTLQGQLQADSAFGGIVGINENWVVRCQTSGAITADTFDVAGICAENRYLLRDVTNGADIAQHTDLVGWNPLAAGVVLTNNYVVQGGSNNGSVISVSDADTVSDGGGTPCAYTAGVAYQNYSIGSDSAYLTDCANKGNITASATAIDASATGICNGNNGGIQACVNDGKVSAGGTKKVDAAGIVNLAYGYVYQCVNSGVISAESQEEARVGGIVGTSCAQILECLSVGNLVAVGNECYVGGILGYSMGYAIQSNLYFGTAERSIAECAITVTAISSTDGITVVGGIVGYMDEKSVPTDTASSNYEGGKVTECYFTGNLRTGVGAYCGGIVGVVGNNIYLAFSTVEGNGNFYGNMYTDGCGASSAFGAAFAGSDYVSVTDVGATTASLTEIDANATYRAILQIFEKNLR